MSTIEVMPARLTREETEDLRQAVACLEATSFAQRLTDAIGRPVGIFSRTVPEIGAAGGRAGKRDRLAWRVEARAQHHRPQGAREGQQAQP